jgi:hypothetical protein
MLVLFYAACSVGRLISGQSVPKTILHKATPDILAASAVVFSRLSAHTWERTRVSPFQRLNCQKEELNNYLMPHLWYTP